MGLMVSKAKEMKLNTGKKECSAEVFYVFRPPTVAASPTVWNSNAYLVSRNIKIWTQNHIMPSCCIFNKFRRRFPAWKGKKAKRFAWKMEDIEWRSREWRRNGGKRGAGVRAILLPILWYAFWYVFFRWRERVFICLSSRIFILKEHTFRYCMEKKSLNPGAGPRETSGNTHIEEKKSFQLRQRISTYKNRINRIKYRKKRGKRKNAKKKYLTMHEHHFKTIFNQFCERTWKKNFWARKNLEREKNTFSSKQRRKNTRNVVRSDYAIWLWWWWRWWSL